MPAPARCSSASAGQAEPSCRRNRRQATRLPGRRSTGGTFASSFRLSGFVVGKFFGSDRAQRAVVVQPVAELTKRARQVAKIADQAVGFGQRRLREILD